jgi:hypothetical protein
MKKIFILSIMILMIFVAWLNADERNYVWTYEYKTMPAGSVEFEHYLTLKSPDIENLEGNVTTTHSIEFEIGMSDHFDFSVYQNFSQGPDSPLMYDGFKLRWRYRFGEKDDFILDPLIYFEYKGVPDFHEHEFEGKIILAKDVGKYNVAFNPGFETEFENNESTTEYFLNAGLSYKVSELFTLGIEYQYKEYGQYFGPVIAHGAGGLWVALGSAIAVSSIDEGKPEVMMRMILGIELGN